MSASLLTLLALPAAASVCVAFVGPPSRAARLAVLSTGVSFLLAIVLTSRVGDGGAVVTAVVHSAHGGTVAGWYLDRLTGALLILVLGVSTVVQAFAARYLAGDLRARAFFAATGVLASATAAMVSAATLLFLAGAWSIAGMALCLLLGLYRGLPAARAGVRRTAWAFLVGDAALWLAVLIASARWGTLDLRTLSSRSAAFASHPGTVCVVACLLLAGAIARSAQLPLQRWLATTLAAPTPVSALLHAGVVNAGGILLVRLSPLFGDCRMAGDLAFAAGALTLAYGTALMLVKPDVKGALAHSTMGQMGFMVMTCGLGAFAAAIFHLIAHGMYKAAFFLGSGSAVERHERHRNAPSVIALSARETAWATARRRRSGNRAPARCRGRHAPRAQRRAWERRSAPVRVGHRRGCVLGLAVHAPQRDAHLCPSARTTAGALSYLAALGAVTSFLAPSLAGAGVAAASPWLIVPLALMLAACRTVGVASMAGRVRELRKTLYVVLLSASQTPLLRRPAGLRLPAPRSGALVLQLARSGSGRP